MVRPRLTSKKTHAGKRSLGRESSVIINQDIERPECPETPIPVIPSSIKCVSTRRRGVHKTRRRVFHANKSGLRNWINHKNITLVGTSDENEDQMAEVDQDPNVTSETYNAPPTELAGQQEDERVSVAGEGGSSTNEMQQHYFCQPSSSTYSP